MQLSIITPSIRPRGVEVVREALDGQDFKDWEWLVQLDKPGPTPTLCRAFNKLIDRAKGDLIVFIQDYITVPPDAIRMVLRAHRRYPTDCYTFPVGKTDHMPFSESEVKWDWRKGREKDSVVPYGEWEIDFGLAPKRLLVKAGLFDEDYDSGFGWENVDMAYRLYKMGVTFRVDSSLGGVALDHDKFIKHPYKKNPNDKLWLEKQKEIDARAIL